MLEIENSDHKSLKSKFFISSILLATGNCKNRFKDLQTDFSCIQIEIFNF